MNTNRNKTVRYRQHLKRTRSSRRSTHRPFWIPGISYYFLSIAVGLTVFFLIWGVLAETGEATPFIPAGIVASFFLISAFLVREVLIKRARVRRMETQRQLDLNLDEISRIAVRERAKLTVSQNNRLLHEVFRRSGAARTLKQVPDAHWEVFELCENYLARTRKEIAKTHVNSPRFGPISKGRKRVKKLHRFHLLEWARERSGILSLDSQNSDTTFEAKIAQAESAQESLGIALEYYPREKKLQESHEAVNEYLSTIRISRVMQMAESAEREGDMNRARHLYGEARSVLQKGLIKSRDREIIAEKIDLKITELLNNRKDT